MPVIKLKNNLQHIHTAAMNKGFFSPQFASTQPTFTCSKSVIEAPEKGAKYVQS